MNPSGQRYSVRLKQAAEEFLADLFASPTVLRGECSPLLVDAAMYIVTDAEWTHPGAPEAVEEAL